MKIALKCSRQVLSGRKNNLYKLKNKEVKEVDLQKEIDKEWEKCNPIDEGMGVESAFIHIEAFDMIARHFFELGLKAQKGE